MTKQCNRIKIQKIKRVANGEDIVMIGTKQYAIRFSAKHAQHIDNYTNSAHQIQFGQIVNLLKVSIVLTMSGKKWVAVGKFGNKIYETYFYIVKDRIDVVKFFISNKLPYTQVYKITIMSNRNKPVYYTDPILYKEGFLKISWKNLSF